MNKHTPTPCEKCGSPKVSGSDLCFAHGGEKAATPCCNAASQLERVRQIIARENPKAAEGYFLRAVNSHEELLELLAAAKRVVAEYSRLPINGPETVIIRSMDDLQDAIAKAEGKL